MINKIILVYDTIILQMSCDGEKILNLTFSDVSKGGEQQNIMLKQLRKQKQELKMYQNIQESPQNPEFQIRENPNKLKKDHEEIHKKNIQKWKETGQHDKQINYRSRILKLTPRATQINRQKKIKQNQKKFNENLQFIKSIKKNANLPTPTPKYRQFISLDSKQIKIVTSSVKAVNRNKLKSIQLPQIHTKPLNCAQRIFNRYHINFTIIERGLKKPKPFSMYNVHFKHNEIFANPKDFGL